MISLLLFAAASGGLADLALLDRGAERFAGAPIGAPGGPATPIDRRLRLAACGGSPEYSWRGPTRDAIVIRCPDASGWRLFIQVQPGGATLRATTPAEPVIKRGDPVTLVAENPGFAVSTDGVAMGDAVPGARLQVKVDGARAPVQAIAVEPGKATLPGW